MSPVMSERSKLASDLGDRLVLLGPAEASDLQSKLQYNVQQVSEGARKDKHIGSDSMEGRLTLKYHL